MGNRGVFGIARPTSSPRILQSASNTGNGGATVTLAAMPASGSLLFAACSSQESTASVPTISGGGARWGLMGRVSIPSGAQLELSLWGGVVGTSPSTSTTISWINAGAGGVIEVAGLAGSLTAISSSSGGAGSFTLSNLVDIAGGLSLFVVGDRGTPTLPSGWTTVVDRTNAARLIMAVRSPWRFPGGTITGLTFSSSSNHSAISAIVK